MFHEQEHLKRRLQHESHSANHKQLFQCLDCGKQYNTQLGYRRHLVAAHGTTTTTATAITSSTAACPEGAPSLLEHLGGHIDRPPPPVPPPSLEGPPGPVAGAVRERKYSCERCDRRFYTRKDVRRHAVVHTGRRDFLCPRCAQRFGRRDHLTRHLKKSHAQEGGALPHHCTPAASPGAARHCLVKEEPGQVASDLGSALSKEAVEPQYPRDGYPSYPMAGAVPGLAHSAHGLVQNHHLSSGMSAARHMQTPQSSHPHHPHPHLHHMQTPPQPQAYGGAGGGAGRYQHGSTSFPRAEVDSFLLDLQSAPSPHLTVANSSSSAPASPQREVLGEGVGGDPHLLSRSPAVPSSEMSCTTNMDLGPLLGFLPFGLPPYSPHMGMSGLVMGYPPPPPPPAAPTAVAPTSSSSSSSPPSSSSSGLSSQGPPPGPFALFQPPQAHVPQGPAVHNHGQLPQAYSSPSMSAPSSLPHYYQAFQQ